jgi:ferredoxin
MVKAIRKPLEEIAALVGGRTRVLVVGCGGCVSVCLAGGQRETLELAAELAESARARGDRIETSCVTVERQCDAQYLAEIQDMTGSADCALSMACGAGIQHLADAFPRLPVFPAVNTAFVGIDRDVGLYEERCRTCGDCMLGYTGGICPVTRCAKSIFNGPCGGTHPDGTCEVGGVPCAWTAIHERLTAQGRLQEILRIRPAMGWIDKGPGVFVQRGYESRHRPGEGGAP